MHNRHEPDAQLTHRNFCSNFDERLRHQPKRQVGYASGWLLVKVDCRYAKPLLASRGQH